jgi:hypothetical protein
MPAVAAGVFSLMRKCSSGPRLHKLPKWHELCAQLCKAQDTRLLEGHGVLAAAMLPPSFLRCILCSRKLVEVANTFHTNVQRASLTPYHTVLLYACNAALCTGAPSRLP